MGTKEQQEINKKSWIRLDNVRSIGFNKALLSGDFQFDSYEREDDDKTCYVSRRFGNGMCYMIQSELAAKFLMIPQPKH